MGSTIQRRVGEGSRAVHVVNEVDCQGANDKGNVMFRIVEAKSGSLFEVVKTAIANAAKEGLRPFVYFYADWCPPCRAVRESMQDRRMIDAFDGTYILKLRADEWGDAGKATGFVFNAIPAFFRLDPDGRPVDRIDGGAWGENTPAHMAPSLKRFLRPGGGLLSRFVRWINQGIADGKEYHGKTLAQWAADYKKLAEAERSLSKKEGFRRTEELDKLKTALATMRQLFCEIGPPVVPGAHPALEGWKIGSNSVGRICVGGNRPAGEHRGPRADLGVHVLPTSPLGPAR